MACLTKPRQLLLLLWTLLFFTSANAQIQKADSLENILKKHPAADTTKVNLLNQLAYELYMQDPDKAMTYATQAETIANRLYYLKGKAASIRNVGVVLSINDKKKALNYFRRALFIAEKANDKAGICNCLISIGTALHHLEGFEKGDPYQRKAYRMAKEIQNKELIIKTLVNISLNEQLRGNTTEAIKTNQEIIALTKESGDKKMLAHSYAQLATCYIRQGKNSAALEQCLTALKIEEELGNKQGALNKLINMAGIQRSQKDFDSALKTLKKAHLLAKEMGSLFHISICLNNIGNIYLDKKDPSALSYFQKALAASKMNRPDLNIEILVNIGRIYIKQGNYDEALKHLERAEEIAMTKNAKAPCNLVWLEMGHLYHAQNKYDRAIEYTQKVLQSAGSINIFEIQKEAYELLSQLYATTGAYQKAYQNHVLYKAASDSLFNEKTTREIAILESNYQYDKEKQTYEMRQASQAMKIKNQKQIIFFLIVASILIFMLAFAIYWTSKLKKKLLRLKLEDVNRELKINQKAMAAAKLKLIQNAERDAYSVKMLESIKKNTVEEGQNDIRSLISEYKLKSYNSNWEEFEILFEKVNASFYERLYERFPNLTTNEKRLCVFLKMNMSNNHISQITFQSEEALKKARLRLRKKLDIDRNINLEAFIQSL